MKETAEEKTRSRTASYLISYWKGLARRLSRSLSSPPAAAEAEVEATTTEETAPIPVAPKQVRFDLQEYLMFPPSPPSNKGCLPFSFTGDFGYFQASRYTSSLPRDSDAFLCGLARATVQPIVAHFLVLFIIFPLPFDDVLGGVGGGGGAF